MENKLLKLATAAILLAGLLALPALAKETAQTVQASFTGNAEFTSEGCPPLSSVARWPGHRHSCAWISPRALHRSRLSHWSTLSSSRLSCLSRHAQRLQAKPSGFALAEYFERLRDLVRSGPAQAPEDWQVKKSKRTAACRKGTRSAHDGPRRRGCGLLPRRGKRAGQGSRHYREVGADGRPAEVIYDSEIDPALFTYSDDYTVSSGEDLPSQQMPPV